MGPGLTILYLSSAINTEHQSPRKVDGNGNGGEDTRSFSEFEIFGELGTLVSEVSFQYFGT